MAERPARPTSGDGPAPGGPAPDGPTSAAGDPSTRGGTLYDLFRRALEVPVDERPAFVERACAGRPELRDQLQALLGADARDDFTLPALDVDGARLRELVDDLVAGDGDRPPEDLRIEGFQLVRRLGSGGMGTVWEALQEEPGRRVALKLVHPALAGADQRERFRREAAALARLSHPGIAAIHAAGTARAPWGDQPWVAMELVDGLPLLEAAHARGLDRLQRLELLIELCDAVDHAHRQGVLHRDLKPGNILVDGQGQPRILDFGVARILDEEAAPALRTVTGALVGTLAYMSPEQAGAEGRGLDRRSDVFALGVVGFELLTGRLPRETDALPLPAALRRIREDEAPLAGGLDPALRGDVETILAKALAHEPGQRYDSARELADDLRRHLADLPIRARPAGRWYRARKFVRRHRGLVAGVLAGVVLLTVGLVSALVQADAARQAEQVARDEATRARDAEQRALDLAAAAAAAEDRARDEAARAHNAEDTARREAANARALFDYVVEDLLSAASPLEQGRDVRVLDVLERAAAGLEQRFADEPAVQATLAATLGVALTTLGALDRAEPLLRRALALREEHGPADALELARARVQLGQLLKAAERPDEAEPLLRAGLAELTALARAGLADRAEAELALGHLLGKRAAFDEAQPHLERALALRREAGAGPVALAEALGALGDLHLQRGDLERAEPLLHEASEALRGEGGLLLAHALDAEGRLLRRRARLDRAEALLTEAVALKRALLGDEHDELADSLSNLGLVLVARGRPGEAIDLFQEALGIQLTVHGEAGPVHGKLLMNLGLACANAGRTADAEQAFGEALRILEASVPADDPALLYARMNLAAMAEQRGDLQRALELQRPATEALVALYGPTHRDRLVAELNLGHLLARLGRFDEAAPLFAGAVEGYVASGGPDDADANDARFRLAQVRLAQGRRDEAGELLELVLAVERRADPTAPRQVDPGAVEALLLDL